MLLQDQCIGILFVAHRTLMEHPHWGLSPMHAHMSLEIALGGKGSGAYPTLEWPLSSVSSVVHLEGRFARQYSVTNDTLIWIR